MARVVVRPVAPRWRSSWRSGGGQVRLHGLDQLALVEQVDAALVDPDSHQPPARAWPIRMRCTRGSTLSWPLLATTVSNSTARFRRPAAVRCPGRSRLDSGGRKNRGRLWDRLGGEGSTGSVGAKAACRGGHVQRLVWMLVVVAVHPRVDGRQVRERAGLVEQLAAQGPMEPLHLPGRGGRALLGQPGGELLSVVRQHFRGRPVAAQCCEERVAHGRSGRQSPSRSPRTGNGH